MPRKVNMETKKVLQHLKRWLRIQEIFKSRKEISQYLHISHSHLYNIINGKAIPKKEIIEKIKIMINYDKDIKGALTSHPEKRGRYLDFAMELRKWFDKQNDYKTRKDFAAALEISYYNLHSYFQGRRFPKGSVRKKMYNITGIKLLNNNEYIKDNASNKKELNKGSITLNNHIDKIHKASNLIQDELILIKNNFLNNKINLLSLENEKNQTDRVIIAFYTLAKELMTFKESPEQERHKLTQRLSPKDVGYVISFLKALFDDDKFLDFIFFTKFDFEEMEDFS